MGRLTRSNPKLHSAGDRRTKRLALDESLVSKPSSAGRLSSSKGVLKRERTPVSVDKLPQRRESMLPRASEKFTSASAVNSREAKIMDRNPRPPPQRRKRPPDDLTTRWEFVNLSTAPGPKAWVCGRTGRAGACSSVFAALWIFTGNPHARRWRLSLRRAGARFFETGAIVPRAFSAAALSRELLVKLLAVLCI